MPLNMSVCPIDAYSTAQRSALYWILADLAGCNCSESAMVLRSIWFFQAVVFSFVAASALPASGHSSDVSCELFIIFKHDLNILLTGLNH